MKENINKYIKIILFLLILSSVIIFPIKVNAYEYWQYPFNIYHAIKESNEDDWRLYPPGTLNYWLDDNTNQSVNWVKEVFNLGQVYKIKFNYIKQFYEIDEITCSNNMDYCNIVGDTVYVRLDSRKTNTSYQVGLWLKRKESADIPGQGLPAVMTPLKARVLDQNGNPVQNAWIRIARTSVVYNSSYNKRSYTDEFGESRWYEHSPSYYGEEYSAVIFEVPAGYEIVESQKRFWVDGSGMPRFITLYVKNLLDEDLGIIGNALRDIKIFFANLISSIVDMFSMLFTNLFVPSSEFMIDFIDELRDYLSVKFGFLYESIDTFIDFINNVKNINSVSSINLGQMFGESINVDFSILLSTTLGQFILIIIRGSYLLGLLFAGYILIRKVLKI